MRSAFSIALIVTLLFSGGYLYYTALAICPIPLEYRIGDFDDRFNISLDEARVITSEAEAVWEDATGRNLFSYDEDADFTVNFVFDDRQALSDAERDFRERLNQTQSRNESLNETYAVLIDEYNGLSVTYENRAAAYERDLSSYNALVRQYNSEGGAPPEAFDELEAERVRLDAEKVALTALATELNGLVDNINQLSDQGNQLIETYNRNVETYNDTFGGAREFTQGDYRGDHINIYKFSDENELRTVLSHEFGHALGLDHVAGESSLMYYLMGGQSPDLQLTPSDLAEFVRVCGADTSTTGRILRTLMYYIDSMQRQINAEHTH